MLTCANCLSLAISVAAHNIPHHQKTVTQRSQHEQMQKVANAVRTDEHDAGPHLADVAQAVVVRPVEQEIDHPHVATAITPNQCLDSSRQLGESVPRVKQKVLQIGITCSSTPSATYGSQRRVRGSDIGSREQGSFAPCA